MDNRRLLSSADKESVVVEGGEIMKWTVDDVVAGLIQAGLSDLVPVFQQRQIDGAALLSLTEEQLLFWKEITIRQRKQITKYINQCKEEMTLQNARKKILSVTKKNQPPPTPLPADYVAGSYSEDDYGDGWDTDFDDVSDGDDDDFEENVRNGYSVNQPNECVNIPLTHNESEDAPTVNGFSEHVVSPCGTPLQLPPFPVIPKRQPKLSEALTSKSSSDSSSETSKSKTPSPGKPQVHPKPIFNAPAGAVVKQPVAVTSRSLSQSAIPRPPGTLLARTNQRHSTSRPTDLPPPPPVKHKPPEPVGFPASEEEYEIPCTSSDVASTSSNTSSSLHEQGGENYETIDQVKDNASSDLSDTCSLEHPMTTRQPSFGDQPSLPPRRPSGTPQTLTAPPLPLMPKPIITQKPVESSPSKPKPKPIPLPTRTDSSGDERASKAKDGPATFAKKLSNIWPRRDTDKMKNDRLTNGYRSSNYPEQTGPVSTPSPEATLTKAKSLSRIHSSQSSIDDSCSSVQKRPLPPVPDPLVASSRRPSLPTLVDSPRELMDSFAWYHCVEREVAELKLKEQGSNGSYLVRPSRRAGEASPYTLSILSESRVFHLNVRRIANNRFALGKEKYNEKTFNSVEELIAFHQVEPILLTSGGNAAGCTKLMYTPTRR